jgi:hypothetical protein
MITDSPSINNTTQTTLINQISLLHCMNDLAQILAPKYHIYGQGKHKDQKDGVKYRFFLISHLFTLSFTVSYSIRLIFYSSCSLRSQKHLLYFMLV